ncbi:T9SS type A sorting domain-containing protein [Algibacter miyuki]|uniref:T9SS type A sorting domain-containing protein n=1 Tax=Algibacter miyuki TaxID=1306933 RepID=A0ABV5GZD5_9FLAO|nr:T9SS type A sorting domain-containing protein [Algibacter miyuki]MDN3666816.1 T9SS type A sorting domain-containing protein [Algibacter miyuki]
MTNKLYFIGVFLSSLMASAQFGGGQHDGSDSSTRIGSRLSGEVASVSVLYQGNMGDGFDVAQNQVLLTNSNFNIYRGSSGDGFSKNNASVTLSGSNIKSLYFGSIGDGHAENHAQSLIRGELLSMLYQGNIGDGATENGLNNVFVTGFILDIFKGGSGDGATSKLSANSLLSGLLTALYNGGHGDGFSVEDITTTFISLGLVEELVKLEVLLYPNPASDLVHLKAENNTEISNIQLYDVTGKNINIKLSKNNTLNVSSLSEGVYLLNIISVNNKITKKLIIKR